MPSSDRRGATGNQPKRTPLLENSRKEVNKCLQKATDPQDSPSNNIGLVGATALLTAQPNTKKETAWRTAPLFLLVIIFYIEGN